MNERDFVDYFKNEAVDIEKITFYRWKRDCIKALKKEWRDAARKGLVDDSFFPYVFNPPKELLVNQ